MLLQISLILQVSENGYEEAAEVVKLTLQLKADPQNFPPPHTERTNSQPITGNFLQEQS